MGSAVNPVKSIIADIMKLPARQDTITHFPSRSAMRGLLRLCANCSAFSLLSANKGVYLG
jgi:hypothetical protein